MSETYRVTARGVIHREDCAHVTGPCSRSILLTYGGLLKSDKPCSRCLPNGLPTETAQTRRREPMSEPICACGSLTLATTASERHDRGLHGPDGCLDPLAAWRKDEPDPMTEPTDPDSRGGRSMSDRERLAKVTEVLGEHTPVYDYRNGHFTMECEACDFILGGVDRDQAKQRFGAHFADILSPLLGEWQAEDEARALRAAAVAVQSAKPFHPTRNYTAVDEAYDNAAHIIRALAAAEPDAGER